MIIETVEYNHLIVIDGQLRLSQSTPAAETIRAGRIQEAPPPISKRPGARREVSPTLKVSNHHGQTIDITGTSENIPSVLISPPSPLLVAPTIILP